LAELELTNYLYVVLDRLGHGSGYIPWIKGYFSVVLHPAVSHWIGYPPSKRAG
jgi:hypothetical protein